VVFPVTVDFPVLAVIQELLVKKEILELQVSVVTLVAVVSADIPVQG